MSSNQSSFLKIDTIIRTNTYIPKKHEMKTEHHCVMQYTVAKIGMKS